LAARDTRDLVQIVYVSTAATTAPEAVTDVAERSRRSNEARGLTGLKVHHGRHFYAILEGPRRKVFDRIEEIIGERAEQELRILREEPIEHRRFANWSFGTLPPTVTVGDRPDEFLRRFCRSLR